VVEQACDWQGYRNRGHKYVRGTVATDALNQSSIARRLDKTGKRLGLRDKIRKKKLSNKDRDRQVTATVKELFPLIPDRDVKSILSRAFEEVR